MPLKWFLPIKKKPVSVVGLVDTCVQLLTYPHHLGVKVSNPIHLDGFIGKPRSARQRPVIFHYHGTFHTLTLEFRHHPEHQAQHLIRWVEGFVPKKFQLSYQVHLSVYVLEKLINLWNVYKKRNRLAFIETKIDQPDVHDGLHLRKHKLCFLECK